MADEMTYECNTGVLVTKDEEGNYLPFLLRVRAKEILWGGNTSDSVLLDDDFLEQLRNLGVTDFKQVNPVPSYKFKLDGWDVHIEGVTHVVYIKEMSFSELEEMMKLEYVDKPITVGDVTHEYDDVDPDNSPITPFTVVHPERKYYSATLNLPLAIKREGIHVSSVVNILEPEYRSTNVDIVLPTGNVSDLGLYIMIETTPFSSLSPYIDVNPLDSTGIILKYCAQIEDPVTGDLNTSIVAPDFEVIPDPFPEDPDNPEDVLVIDLTTEPVPPKESSVIFKIEGELAEQTIYKDDDILPEVIDV